MSLHSLREPLRPACRFVPNIKGLPCGVVTKLYAQHFNPFAGLVTMQRRLQPCDQESKTGAMLLPRSCRKRERSSLVAHLQDTVQPDSPAIVVNCKGGTLKFVED